MLFIYGFYERLAHNLAKSSLDVETDRITIETDHECVQALMIDETMLMN